jgi:hypothetical protein
MILHEVGAAVKDDSVNRNRGRKRSVQNHLLQDWLNVYVRDVAKLMDFEPDPTQLFHTLGGIASSQRIERPLQFLLREGFLCKTNETAQHSLARYRANC